MIYKSLSLQLNPSYQQTELSFIYKYIITYIFIYKIKKNSFKKILIVVF